jgi:Bacterial extracellular solute-binding proteins, family 5 Middle
MVGESTEQGKSQKIFVVAGVLALCLGIGGFLFYQRQKSSSVDPGWMDWNLGRGAQAEVFRENLSEPYIAFIEQGAYVNRLAREVVFKEGVGTVTLRDGVLWSDGTRLTSQHVVDAWKRFSNHAWKPGELTGDEEKWRTGLSVTETGSDTITIEGLATEKELHEILRGYLLGPIREDLVSGPTKAINGTVTIGRFLVKDSNALLNEKGELRLSPNPYFYRGRELGDKFLKRDGEGVFR